MRNGKEGVSYRLVFLNGSTAVKTVNFVDGVASDSTAFSTEGNYTIALVAGTVVLQQYANIRVGNPPAQTYTLTGTIRNNPGSSAIIFTVDGNVVASGSQVAEGKTVHVEITNADQDWEAFTVNNQTKVTTASGTSRVVDFTMPSSNASCVASFTAPTPAGGIEDVTIGGTAMSADAQISSDVEVAGSVTFANPQSKYIQFVKSENAPTVGSALPEAILHQHPASDGSFTVNSHSMESGKNWLVYGSLTETMEGTTGYAEAVWPYYFNKA